MHYRLKIMDIPVKETTLSGWLVPTNPDRGSNGSGVLTQDQNSLEKMEEGQRPQSIFSRTQSPFLLTPSSIPTRELRNWHNPGSIGTLNRNTWNEYPDSLVKVVRNIQYGLILRGRIDCISCQINLFMLHNPIWIWS